MPDTYTDELLNGEKSIIYDFFSYVLLKEMSKSDLLHLKENIPRLSGDVADGNSNLSLVADFLSEHEVDLTVLDELAADYACLFLGLTRKSPYPYGSVHLNESGIVMDEESEKVAALYSASGLALADDVSDPPDHLGLELGFMAHLSRILEKSVREENNAELWSTLLLQHDFLKKHINSWFMNFLEDVKHMETKYPFYPALLSLLGDFLEHEEYKLVEFLNENIEVNQE